jgi:hypothetical protein
VRFSEDKPPAELVRIQTATTWRSGSRKIRVKLLTWPRTWMGILQTQGRYAVHISQQSLKIIRLYFIESISCFVGIVEVVRSSRIHPTMAKTLETEWFQGFCFLL